MNSSLFPDPSSAPDSSALYTAHCDGGSRGNPGPAGYGAVIVDPHGHVAARLSEYLGKQTNNFAEYSGLVAVLRWAIANRVQQLKVVSDSELMVKQMSGAYKVSSPGLKPLWEEAKGLAGRLVRFQIAHTLRGGNKEADRLANEAMDRGMAKRPRTDRDQRSAEHGSGSRVSPGSASAPARPAREVFEGLVKDGVVHLIEGELPDGVLVKVIRE
jgi:ribonuclease HI